MSKKEVFLFVLLALGIIISSILLVHVFQYNCCLLFEDILLAVLTGCVFAVPVYIVNALYSKNTYNAINDKVKKIYILLKEISQLSECDFDKNLSERTDKITDVIEQIKEIRLHNFIATKKELDVIIVNVYELYSVIKQKEENSKSFKTAVLEQNEICIKAVEKYLKIKKPSN